MDGPPSRDRLAVWTYVQHGEEILCGDPSVTDAERAAAGRETLAGRWQAVLPGNRSRATAQYSAGLPDGEDMVRVWRRRDPAALRARLGETPLVAWAEDDILHVLWQGTADEVMLGAGVQPRLWPVEGSSDLWEASLRVRRLDEAVISIVAMPRRAGGDEPGRMPDQGVRGPRGRRAARPRYYPDEHPHSAALRGPAGDRLPAARGRGRSLRLADGSRHSASPSWSASSRATPPSCCGRAQCRRPGHPVADRSGYPDRSRARFSAHLDSSPASHPWAPLAWRVAGGLAGFSNGGAWASPPRSRPTFTAVAAFSAGVVLRPGAPARPCPPLPRPGLNPFRSATGGTPGRQAPCRWSGSAADPGGCPAPAAGLAAGTPERRGRCRAVPGRAVSRRPHSRPAQARFTLVHLRVTPAAPR